MKIKSGLIVALAAGSIAGIAQAGQETDALNRIAKAPLGAKAVHGYVYCNGLTGERVVSYQSSGKVQVRGAGWAWDSSYVDPCFPASVGGEDAQIIWVDGIQGDNFGDGASPDDIGAWFDWIETPGDAIVTLISFANFSGVLDPEEDGVDGNDVILVFTENDRAPQRSGAVASTAISFTGLNGANDENSDGIIDFTEANLWIYVYDLAAQATPFDIEIGDTNGQYDGSYPNDGLYSGVPGVDIDGDGWVDSGFVMAWRQPNVAEGDQLIDRFPELAGLGLENPDGLDINTFANLASYDGYAIVNPSANAGVEGEPNCYDANADEWPQVAGCDDGVPFPHGAYDAFGWLDALGSEFGVYWYGGFACNIATPPPYDNPWANLMLSLNVDLIGGNSCPCDMDGNGILDLADISGPNGFIVNFLAGNLAADMNGDGILDLSDISGPNGFIVCFLSGCP
ncbi:MAG: hypothetical protein H6810_00075 [Phycisphaeraceae bacterium]|nr:MAG: hypothetical protein H6810_00075 [Phycisphaeraceae bacterium]